MYPSRKGTAGSVSVFIEKGCNRCNGKSPHNTEISPYHTAAAHPISGCDPAENSLCNISKKCADKKQQYDFIKTAAVGKNLRMCLFALRVLLLRIGFGNSTIYNIINFCPKLLCYRVNIPVSSNPSFRILAVPKNGWSVWQ